MTAVSGSVTVGIDIGTTSVKATAVDAQGEILARSRVRHDLVVPAPDLLEHDAAQAWRRGPQKAFAEVTAGGLDVAGVCVAAMVPSMTAVGKRGVPCAPGLLYGDARGRAFLADPGGQAPVATVETTLRDAEGFLGWASQNWPEARGYWPAQAVAGFALGGVPAIDTAAAMSLSTLMSGATWDADVLNRLGVKGSQMPTIVNMGEAAGEVTGTNTVLAGGCIDALCDQIVSGADEVGDVLVICGATLVVWAVTADWLEAPGLWTVPHTVAGRMLVGGPSNAGALFVDWARSLLHDGFRRAPVAPRGPGRAAGTPAGADRGPEPVRGGDPYRVPVWTPYLRGERVPYHDTSLRAGLHGLDITQDAAAIERAAYEASGFVVRHMLDRAGIAGKRIVATGGGTRITQWMQGMADATGLPVDVVAVHEGAALGAAYLARMAAGLEDSLEGSSRWAKRGHRIEPDPAWTVAATERYAQFLACSPGA